jgi:hypothetical protein
VLGYQFVVSERVQMLALAKVKLKLWRRRKKLDKHFTI